MSLRIPNLPENYLRLIWFYTADQKILEWETNQPNPDYFKTKFKDRVTLGLQDGTLHIYNVQEEDSSIYMLKVMLKSGFEEEWSIPLKVFGKFGEPKGKSPFWAPGWTSGRLPGNQGGSLGMRREKPQDRLNLFLLKPFLLGNEPGLAESKLIVLGHLTPLLMLMSLRFEEKKNNRGRFLSILLIFS